MFFCKPNLNCPICLEDRGNNVFLRCGHIACNRCHKKHMKASIDRRCHICRAPIKKRKRIKFKMDFKLEYVVKNYSVPFYGIEIYGFPI